MPRILDLRVIIESEAHHGDWNMAVDEALLETAIDSRVATLRFYRWREPTVSLGYFQKSSDLLGDAVLSKLPVVRRLTGGGAILHDDELTHSVTLPPDQDLFRQPQELYMIVHGAICQALKSLGFPVEIRGTTVKKNDEPLLCFQRQDSHDVTLNGIKVLGSAQRRRRGAILQHGSLIRRASPVASHLLGLADLCDADLPEDLAEQLAIRVAEAVSVSWHFGFMSDFEIEMTKRLYEQQSSRIPHH